MNIKTILTICFLLIVSITTEAQAYKESIRTDFGRYLNTIERGDFEKSVEYITPEFFDILPKADMIKMMEQAFNNPDIQFNLRDEKILNVGDSREIEGKYYATLQYSNMMDMKIKDGDKGKSSEEKQMNDSIMKAAFNKKFGAENVSFKSETDVYEIYVEKDVWAISANGKTDWKFLVVEDDQEMILKQILPEALIKDE